MRKRDKVSKKAAKRAIEEADGRITQDNIDAHRQIALSKGRKFKYPLQYTKHKLAINTIIIGFVALVAASIFGWIQYYQVQNTGPLAFRFSQYLRNPVAEIDGAKVLYSDYLMQFRSNVRAIERQEGWPADPEDSARMRVYFQRSALDNAILNAHAMRLADDYDITISREEIDATLQRLMTSGGDVIPEASFEKVISDNFGLTKSEYTRMFVEIPLIRHKVSERIDTNAREIIEQVQQKLSAGSDFAAVSEAMLGKVLLESSGGLVDMQNVDGGRAAKASTMNVGEISEPFLSTSGDNFYIIKVTNKDGDRVEYSSLSVALTELRDQVARLREEGKVREFIRIESEEETEE